MRAILTAVTAAGLAMSVPAFAQSSSSSTPSPSTGTATGQAPAPGTMQQSVKHDLEQAGFTNVQVMPSSFLVRAKDKQGRPVMMVINPDSVTEITNVAHATGSGSKTTHQ